MRFTKMCAVAVCICATALLNGQTTPSQSSLTIQVDKPLHAVSPTLYGLMTEEINYSYDGGLYAELVRNRTFQHDWSGIQHWDIEEKGSSALKMVADPTDGPSVALSESVKLEIEKADNTNQAGIRNDGYWGMRVDPNSEYKGSFYAKSAAPLGPIMISLVSNSTGKTLASGTVAQVSNSWARYEYKLKTSDIKSSADNHLLISVAQAGTLWLQLVSLFPPTYKDQANGFRPDLMKMMQAMHPKFLRLPGGNYLEGDRLLERFDWKTTIGPLVDRPTHRGPWGYQSTDGMGLLEYLEWCEDLHVEPVLAVFAGYTLNHDYIRSGPALEPYVQDALDEIEFVAGDTSTKWGAARAKLGHAAPFALRYVEIGNEDEFDVSGSYEGRYKQFYTAIKAKHPGLQLIATTPLKRFRPDVIDDHYYKKAGEFYNFNRHYDDADRSGPKIFVGEWATREGSPTTNMGAALGDASWMTAMERNSDLIILASYAPLFVNVSPGGMQWESDLIGYNAFSAYGSPSYYAQSLFSEYLGDQYLAANATGIGNRLFYSVTKDTAKGKVYLKLVNAASTPATMQIVTQGAERVGEKAQLVSLTGTNPSETNTIDEPVRIVPQSSGLRVGKEFKHTVPAYSIQVIVLDAK